MGSSLSILEKEPWKHASKKIGEFGLGFSPPSYHNIRHSFLDKCYDEVKERVIYVTLSNLKLLGCTIVSYGWSNVQLCPLINVMVMSPHGKHFLRVVDSSRQIKAGAYIAQTLASAIDDVEPTNVLQVVMDNAKNYRATCA